MIQFKVGKSVAGLEVNNLSSLKSSEKKLFLQSIFLDQRREVALNQATIVIQIIGPPHSLASVPLPLIIPVIWLYISGHPREAVRLPPIIINWIFIYIDSPPSSRLSYCCAFSGRNSVAGKAVTEDEDEKKTGRSLLGFWLCPWVECFRKSVCRQPLDPPQSSLPCPAVGVIALLSGLQLHPLMHHFQYRFSGGQTG